MAGSEYNTKREYQNQGIGGRLLVESMELAKQQDYKGILICGVPTYYPKFGFKTADTFGITMPDGSNFEAFMGYELQKNALSDHKGKFYEPQSLCCDIHDEEYMRS
ncbi:MAG: N-acetyltransferase [Lachnospiraceae bacterium]|nr:N-acetyltransferase [Lachnospiraceae bacterium]MBR6157877.1 N-acetyltransferase [Lachnospiraceae bacterium]MBR6850596.1 N-acetyltransferase [Lachnospiraceae bacterium]